MIFTHPMVELSRKFPKTDIFLFITVCFLSFSPLSPVDALNRYYRETPITCFGTLAQIFVQNHADGVLGHLSPSFIDWRESLRATLVYNYPTHDQAKVAFDKFGVNFVQPWQGRFLAALSFDFGPDEKFPCILNHFAQK